MMAFIAGACTKDKGDPPVLPPATSMTIDFSNFTSLVKSAETRSVKGENNSAWEFAAVPVVFWKYVVNTILYIPVASFKVTIDQNPVYVAEKTWEWKYSTTIENINYQTRLNGQITGNEVKWKMYITKQNGFTDFLWFEGTSALDGKSGQWILYQDNENPNVKILQIDWSAIDGSTIPHVTYTYVKEGFNSGNFIEYGPLSVTGSQYNSFYKIKYSHALTEKTYSIDVEWNSGTKKGRVKSPDYLLGEWYCWDSNRINVSCN